MALFARQNKNAAIGTGPGQEPSGSQNVIEKQQNDFFNAARKRAENRKSGDTIVAKDVWKRWPKERTMLIMVIVMVLIFVFFFLSPVLFTGGSKDVGDPTPVGSEVSLSNGDTLTITSWKYSPAQGMMEIRMNVSVGDYAATDAYDYQVSLKHGSSKMITVEPVVNDNDFIVLIIRGIPERWTALRVNVFSLAEVNSLQSGKSTKNIQALGGIMCLKKEVSRVSKIVPKTPNAYRADVYLDQIPQYQEDIDEAKAQIVNDQNQIKEIENNLTRLQKQAQEPMPKSQLQGLYNQMDEARQQEQELKDDIQGQQATIQQAERVIANLRAQASYYSSDS